jgi:DNA-binding NarL/FixJ family response regulator
VGKKKASRSAGRVARLAGASVLLVEDDFILLSELEMVVSDAGADIVGACRTAEESLEIIATSKVDAAILDFRLTNGSSGEIANALVKARIPLLW